MTLFSASLSVPPKPLRLAPVLLVALCLTGCPQSSPGAGAFALDSGGADVTGAVQDTTAPVDASVPDGVAAQLDGATTSDGTASDTASQPLPCTGPLQQWFTKSMIAPQYEQARGVKALPGGGFVIVGDAGSDTYKRQARLTRLSDYGTLIWHRTLGSGEKEDRGEALVVLADGYAVAGAIRSVSAGASDGWIIRTDLDGNKVWAKSYGGEKTDLFEGIAATSDGGFVAAGTNRSIKNSLEDGWLLRTDKDGVVLWQDTYGGSHIDQLRDVVANGTGFAAAGENWSAASTGSDAWLLLVNAKGLQTASKVYGKGDKDWARALVRMPDGGFALTGKASDKGNPKLWVIRTDAQGNMLWESVRGDNQSEQGWGIAVTTEGGLVVVGDTNSGKTGTDAWQLRYDAYGNLLWDQRYGGAGNQWAAGVVALPAGGSLLVGRAWNSGSLDDVFLVRSGPWGHGSCEGVGPCGAKVQADCDDGLPCTADRCDSIDGCTHTNLLDKAACGVAMLCVGGKCLQG